MPGVPICFRIHSNKSATAPAVTAVRIRFQETEFLQGSYSALAEEAYPAAVFQKMIFQEIPCPAALPATVYLQTAFPKTAQVEIRIQKRKTPPEVNPAKKNREAVPPTAQFQAAVRQAIQFQAAVRQATQFQAAVPQAILFPTVIS